MTARQSWTTALGPVASVWAPLTLGAYVIGFVASNVVYGHFAPTLSTDPLPGRYLAAGLLSVALTAGPILAAVLLARTAFTLWGLFVREIRYARRLPESGPKFGVALLAGLLLLVAAVFCLFPKLGAAVTTVLLVPPLGPKSLAPNYGDAPFAPYVRHWFHACAAVGVVAEIIRRDWAERGRRGVSRDLARLFQGLALSLAFPATTLYGYVFHAAVRREFGGASARIVRLVVDANVDADGPTHEPASSSTSRDAVVADCRDVGEATHAASARGPTRSAPSGACGSAVSDLRIRVRKPPRAPGGAAATPPLRTIVAALVDRDAQFVTVLQCAPGAPDSSQHAPLRTRSWPVAAVKRIEPVDAGPGVGSSDLDAFALLELDNPADTALRREAFRGSPNVSSIPLTGPQGCAYLRRFDPAP